MYYLDTIKVRFAGERPTDVAGDPMGAMRQVRQVLETTEAPPDQETFGFLALDSRHRLIGFRVLYTGASNCTPVEVRQVFRDALALSAVGIILFHTHPSGDLTPSADDESLTRQAVAAGRIVGISVLDHIIHDSDASRVYAVSMRQARAGVFA